MTPKEKAEQLVNSFSPYVYCYMGSGMLTNTSNDEVIKMNAKQCALIAVDELIELSRDTDSYYKWTNFYQEVKQEIEKI